MSDQIPKTLERFGFGGIGLNESDFCKKGMTIQLGREPRRIDILTSISGVNTDQAFQGWIEARLLDLKLPFIGREDLILNKTATRREKVFAMRLS